MRELSREERLKRVMVHFTQTMVSDFVAEQALDELMAAVPELLDVDGAGIMLEDDTGELRFVAASNERLRLIEEFQVHTGQGPCVMAFETGEKVVAEDLNDERRFPAFAETALAAGMQAVHSFPMLIQGLRVGALNLYRDMPGALPEDGDDVGALFADMATSYLFSARRHDRLTRQVEGLRVALDENGTIDQAKGVLMHSYAMEDREAFGALRRYARRHQHRVLDVASKMMDGGITPHDLVNEE